jgi:serine/threonine protein kinase
MLSGSDLTHQHHRGMMENEHAGVESKRDFFHNKEAWECVSEDAKDLVAWMLTTDPDQRPTCEEALDHVWFKHGEAKKRGIDGAREAGAASKKARGQGSRAFSV